MRVPPLQAVLLPYAASAAGGDVTTPTATLDSGPVFGASTSLPGAMGPVAKFLGVPYAASPPGRFRLPRAPDRWTAARNATAFGDSCVQYVPRTDVGPGQDILEKLFNRHPPESEDCLHMTPLRRHGQARRRGGPSSSSSPAGDGPWATA
ncbi:Acetylcholinesterase [Purpureocillium takamizusanense]|uniref:Acetylcholinesterase n=1 Tax=Purpureocillium takamizusanense TaxID=2060973 RepID=A0A9Q8QHZ3_9HYPO|nr:Acetylcholinesterase [Purpureocillium takamizusanense]UNI19587.1 Acetylcholinesterase [Purpureocillium takamizusanense]